MEAADSTMAGDRERVIEAIADADELASALPSVAFYRSGAPNSPHRLLAEGLRRRTTPVPLIVLCAENHRSAAALLEAAVTEAIPPGERDAVRGRVRYVDTVIGKMSGVISDEAELREMHLATIASALPSAFLVEEFDRILVSRVGGDLHPGMPVLREVDDLAPFEDAKLLGHNATHALGAFIGRLLGLEHYADLRAVPGAMDLLRAAFIEESGATLRSRWAGADPLFSEVGYAGFADDRHGVELRTVGSRGMLRLDLRGNVLWRYRGKDDDINVLLPDDAGVYDCIGPIDAVVDTALGRSPANNSPAELGARTVEILDAAYRSAESGVLETIEHG